MLTFTDIVLTLLIAAYITFTFVFGPRAMLFGLRAIWRRATPPGNGILNNHEGDIAVLLGAVAFFNGVLWIGLGIIALIERFVYFSNLFG